VRDIKEQMCHVAANYEEEISINEDPLNFEQRQYELPDNVVIEVKHKKRITAAEVLFNPSLIGYKYQEFEEDHDKIRGGIAKLAYASIKQCDSDLKINLYNNIVLAGGSTMMNGFVDRFEDEIKDMARDDAKTDINISAVLHRKYAAWVGGSMISSFSTFKDMAVTATDYTGQADIEKRNLILKKTIY
jgi:actin-related protein